jgi:hypothetical protein
MEKIYWYRWGDEPQGYVSIWTLNPDRSVKSLGVIPASELPEGAEYCCPYP